MDYPLALRVLEINPDATEEQAAQAYKELVRVWHPDNFGGKPDLLERATTKTKMLNEAWETFQQVRAGRPVGKRSKQLIPLLIGFLVVLLISLLGLAYLLATDGFNPELKLEKTLTEMAHITNQGLPVSLDDDTTLTATFSGPGRTFTYVYQVLNYTRDQVGAAYFEEVRQGLKQSFQAKRAEDPNLRFFDANGVTLRYSFKDQAGQDIVTLEIRPEEYRLSAEGGAP